MRDLASLLPIPEDYCGLYLEQIRSGFRP